MEITIEQNTAYETVVAGRELLTQCVQFMPGQLDDFSRAAIELNVILDELADAAAIDSVPLPAGWYKSRKPADAPAGVTPAGLVLAAAATASARIDTKLDILSNQLVAIEAAAQAMKRRAIAAEEESRRLRFYLGAHPCSKCKAELWWDARRERWNDEYLDNRVTARGNTSRWGGRSYPHIHQPTLPAVF